VREDGGDGEAAGALDIHEEGSWGRDKVLKLVLAGLSGRSWVEKIDGENLFRQHHVSKCIFESILKPSGRISSMCSISSHVLVPSSS